MAHTITATNGAGSVMPVAIEGYSPTRESRNVIRDLLDGSLGVAYIKPRPRSGELRLLFDTRDGAVAAFDLHAEPTSFLLTSGVTDIGMTYALDGALGWDQDAQSGQWFVVVGFQELA